MDYNIRNELFNKINDFSGFTSDMLYNDLIVLTKESEFNDNEFNKFLIGWSLFHTGGLTKDSYISSLGKMTNVSSNNFLKLKNNLKYKFPDWVNIGSLEIKDKPNNLKIYLSVDNSELHKFANMFLLLCLQKGFTDYDFKINNNESLNRRDNVVIYCNEDNLGVYLGLVKEAIEMSPELCFNAPHLLGIPYDDKIYCGIDDGVKSWTDNLSELIFKMKVKGRTTNDIVNLVNQIKLKGSCSLNAIINMDKDKIR